MINVSIETAIEVYLEVMASDTEIDFSDPDDVATRAFKAGAKYQELLGAS